MTFRIEFVDHTADAKFNVIADNLTEAFKGSARAMTIITFEDIEIKQTRNISFEIKTKRIETLLYDFLNELLYYADGENFVPSIFTKLEIKKENDEFKLIAECKGDDYSNYEVLCAIKNMTYNDMEIIENKNEVKITAVVDI